MQSSLYYEDDSKLPGPLYAVKPIAINLPFSDDDMYIMSDLLTIEVKHKVPEYRNVDLAADKAIIIVATMASSQKSRPDTMYIKLSNLPPWLFYESRHLISREKK